MIEDPLGPPVQGPQVMPNPSPEQQSDLAGQWKNWMSNENNRAALLQFGTAMMQPVGLGQNAMGHVGQAVGQAGEAMARRAESDRKNIETDSKADLRGAQATVAEARAANAGTNAARAGDRLEMARERLNFDRERHGTQSLIRLQQQHSRAQKDHNDSMLLTPAAQRTQFPDFDTWVASNPSLQAAVGTGAGGGTTPPAGATPSAPAGGGGTPPISALTEGQNTRFKNGQVWTLRDGQPVKVR